MAKIAQLLTEHIDIWTAADTEKKSGRGRASTNAGSVYGVKKLRELILELAVRGKLVPQDANDEPASELLKRIQAEKVKLIAEGKFKKEKPLVPISEDEKPFELPIGWEFARFGEYLDFQGGGQPPKDFFVEQPLDGYVQLIQIRDLGENPQPVYIPIELASKFCTPKDIMVGRYGASVGKVFWGKDGSYNVALVKIIDDFTVYSKRFLFEFLRSLSGQAFFKGMSRSAQAGFNKGDIELKIVPIPPLEEQHRIVAKVDELMRLCDQLEQHHSTEQQAHENLVSQLLATLTQSQNAIEFNENWQRIFAHFDELFITEASIDALKQTLLQLAVMGKLVPQDANDEPASELLKRIQAEKAKLIAEGRIKKEKPLTAIADNEKLFELPKGWEWVKLEQLAQVGTGATPLRSKPEYFNPAEICWVTSGETSNSFIFKTEQFVSKLALKETNLTVYPIGTLVVAMYGQGKTRGQISELMIEACTNQACAGIQLFERELSHRKYVKLFFEKIYDEIRELSAGGAQPNLNLSKVKETSVPLPSLNEQHRIVAKVDALMGLCDQLKTRIQQANQQQQKVADVLVVQGLA